MSEPTPLTDADAPRAEAPHAEATLATSALAASGLVRSFPLEDRELTVVRDVSLALAPGERAAIVGPSGSGKTTLLQMLGLLDPPTAGEVWVGGALVPAGARRRRAELRAGTIGFVFQFFHLISELTALENVLLPAMIRQGPVTYGANRADWTGRAHALLERFGLTERLEHKPAGLSGGEQQRIAIARALLLDPAVLLCDEPTGNLDTTTGAAVLDLLDEIQEERDLTLLLVTHDPAVAARCARVLAMEDGRLS